MNAEVLGEKAALIEILNTMVSIVSCFMLECIDGNLNLNLLCLFDTFNELLIDSL
jgi:hypothetical protein